MSPLVTFLMLETQIFYKNDLTFCYLYEKIELRVNPVRSVSQRRGIFDMAVDHEEVVLRLGAVEESAKQAHKRLNEMDTLIKSVQSLATSVAGMQNQLTDMNNDIKTLKEKPAKNWELIINTILTTGVGAIIGYLVSIALSAGGAV